MEDRRTQDDPLSSILYPLSSIFYPHPVSPPLRVGLNATTTVVVTIGVI